jgi:hypothetical protein
MALGCLSDDVITLPLLSSSRHGEHTLWHVQLFVGLVTLESTLIRQTTEE